jgi:ornithine decarboxylase
MQSTPEYYGSVGELLDKLAPASPIYCVQPDRLGDCANRVARSWAGPLRFHVRVNPHPVVLQALRRAGITRFSVSSAEEAALLRSAVADGEVLFCNPLSSRTALHEAATRYGVRRFMVDGMDTLRRVLDSVSGGPPELTVLVTLPAPLSGPDGAGHCGARPDDAVELLRTVSAERLPVSVALHPGLLSLDVIPSSLKLLTTILERAGRPDVHIELGATSVGGYPGTWDALSAFCRKLSEDAVRCAYEPARLVLSPNAALVAGGCSVVTRVLLRKAERLHLDEGRFGWLYTLGRERWRTLPPLAVHAWRRDGTTGRFSRLDEAAPRKAFSAFGPTCDSYDELAMPFLLPPDVAEGDFIEVEQMGADALLCATHFNGFYSEHSAVVAPPAPPLPELSLNRGVAS